MLPAAAALLFVVGSCAQGHDLPHGAGSGKAVKPGRHDAPRAGKVAPPPEKLIEWVPIPGGSFRMGSEDGEADEAPVHAVAIRPFQMAKTAVTFRQYRACVEAGACTPPHVSDGACWLPEGAGWKQGDLPASFQGDDQPVVCVDWEQAKAFSEWAGGRLPTEAEWEYAARSAGKFRKYPWGEEEPTCERAVMASAGFGADGERGCGRNATWPVCSKPAGNTAQGLCDMLGNAWTWTQDWYHDSYRGAPADGGAWLKPADTFRVRRGLSWYHPASELRAANRCHDDPNLTCAVIGFRPIRAR